MVEYGIRKYLRKKVTINNVRKRLEALNQRHDKLIAEMNDLQEKEGFSQEAIDKEIERLRAEAATLATLKPSQKKEKDTTESDIPDEE